MFRFDIRLQTLFLTLNCWLPLAVVGSASAEEPVEVSSESTPLRIERNLVYREVSGTQVKADLYRPDDQNVYPLVIMIHGGGWSLGDKWDLNFHAKELARAGFVAVSINYRLAPAAGIEQQLTDCREALNWAETQAENWHADVGTLALWGYSAGAQLAAMLALQPEAQAPPIRAIVAGGIPADFSFVPESNLLLAYVMGGSRKDKPEVYQRFSPLEVAHAGAPPFFIFHGERDKIVPQQVSQRFVDRLEELKVDVENHVVTGKGHMLTFLHQPTRRAARVFLHKHLNTGEVPAGHAAAPKAGAK